MPLGKRRELVREMYQELRRYDAEKYRQLAEGLTMRAAQGKILFANNSDEAVNAAAHVIVGMNIAMNTYEPLPYFGEVIILCSKARFDNKRRYGDSLIKGKLTHFVVAQTHDGILDVSNRTFAAAVAKCLEYAIDEKHHFQPDH
jgi:hypothetical protein